MFLEYDLLCLSHLRWDFVFQRPHHLLTRFDRGRVFFVEEPLFEDGIQPYLDLSSRSERVQVVVPHLPTGFGRAELDLMQERLLAQLVEAPTGLGYLRWYYTPSAVTFTRNLPKPLLTVYDCMDELSHFKNAPIELKSQEAELFRLAELVFTGGHSLYQAKRKEHSNVHAFPSSVEVAHFAKARQVQSDPSDQASIPHPRIGYFGVIDERIDLALLESLARLRPDLHLIMLGPICKIEANELPQAPNLHYLGPKSYPDLPRYLSGWDVAMMPFARNDATLFISPTKTPEYLAGGKPVISTSIADVVKPYRDLGLVRIADEVGAFSKCIDESLAEDPVAKNEAADFFLARNSWDSTWDRMQLLIDAEIQSLRLQPSTFI